MDNFLKKAGGLTGVHVEAFGWDEPFEMLAAHFAHLPGTVLLQSGQDLDCSRYHLLGVLPWLTLESRAEDTRLTLDGNTQTKQTNAFDILRSILDQFNLPAKFWPAPMAAGLMGYLSYDLKDGLEKLPRTSVDDTHLPDLLLYAPSVVAIHDKQTTATRLMIPCRANHPDWADTCLARFHEIISRPPSTQNDFSANVDAMQSNFTREGYATIVKQVIDYIKAGDVYQVNVSQRFRMPFQGSGFELFRHLYDLNPAPFFAFIQAGDHQVISTSPERFLMRNGKCVETRPIKGTRPRGNTNREDLSMRQELAESKKDDAELSMIVDLLRNDLGKVCAAGSVKVTEHKRMEAYQNVYHLVSIVEGELDRNKDAVDLIKATFPGGSITGCPKIRAMEIIDELESCRRHVYCGSIGYIGFDDTLDLSIAIRTATIVNDTISYSVGGGIVFDSDPGKEYEETLYKGRTLSTACKGNRLQDPAPMVWFNGRIVPARAAAVPIDDQGLLYGYGFFETIRVDNGRAPLLAAHLKRLEKTWAALIPGPFPDLTWSDIITAVIRENQLEACCAAVKILVTRGHRTSPPWDQALLVSARPYIHRLKAINHEGLDLGIYPHPRQTPLAGHKTLNYLYYLQAGQWALRNGYHEALILNPDETVSETNTTNLLLINGKEVLRPQSSAVLPGVMAAAVCKNLASWGYNLIERPISVQTLIKAPLVIATNALMGAVPVTRIKNQHRSVDDDLCTRLNDAIIPGWKSAP